MVLLQFCGENLTCVGGYTFSPGILEGREPLRGAKAIPKWGVGKVKMLYINPSQVHLQHDYDKVHKCNKYSDTQRVSHIAGIT